MLAGMLNSTVSILESCGFKVFIGVFLRFNKLEKSLARTYQSTKQILRFNSCIIWAKLSRFYPSQLRFFGNFKQKLGKCVKTGNILLPTCLPTFHQPNSEFQQAFCFNLPKKSSEKTVGSSPWGPLQFDCLNTPLKTVAKRVYLRGRPWDLKALPQSFWQSPPFVSQTMRWTCRPVHRRSPNGQDSSAASDAVGRSGSSWGSDLRRNLVIL